jgi:hypothetical protein
MSGTPPQGFESQQPQGQGTPPGSYGPGYVQTPPAPTAPPAADRGGGLAIAGFVLGILTLVGIVMAVFLAATFHPVRSGVTLLGAAVVGIIGIVIALIGRASRSYRYLATAGLVLSCVGVGLVVAYTVLGLLVRAGVPIYFPIRPRRLR